MSFLSSNLSNGLQTTKNKYLSADNSHQIQQGPQSATLVTSSPSSLSLPRCSFHTGSLAYPQTGQAYANPEDFLLPMPPARMTFPKTAAQLNPSSP